MKKIIILIIVLGISIDGMAQQFVQFKDVAVVGLPEDAKRVETKDVKAYLTNKGFDMGSMLYNAKDIFRVDDMLITFAAARIKLAPDYLKKLKPWMAAHGTGNLTLINNNQVLTTVNISPHSCTYLFYTVNQANTAAFNGSVTCIPADSVRAKALRDTLLKNLNYEN